MRRNTSQKSIFVCQQCGYESAKWMGKCPNCDTWSSLVEAVVEKSSVPGRGSKSQPVEPVSLNQVPASSLERTKTKIADLDTVLGGGLVAGQVCLLAGEPGIGKSTMLLSFANNVSPAVYVSGEESVGQIKIRADRMGMALSSALFIEETDVDVVLASLLALFKKSTISAIIIDSVQTMYTKDLTGIPGSVGQVRETTFRLISFAKKHNIPLMLVGHVTKDGSVAGPATLAHMVDTVLWFEGDRLSQLRTLRSVKNRFASTDEVGIFRMEQSGLVSVDQEGLVFLNSEIADKTPGAVVGCALEGTRPILVEIQALVLSTKLAFPKRVVQGMDSKKIELIIAVLSRHAGLKLANYDVFVNVVGGLKIKDQGIDLAVAFAIASSYKNKSVSGHKVVIGEVGLLGEIRPTMHEDKRLAQAARRGYTEHVSSAKYKRVSEAISIIN